MAFSEIIEENHMPIGVFDSGVGGISVLKEAVKILPHENFIYFGDSKNAPYGIKGVYEVKTLTFSAVHKLIELGVKGIVIACNTATSAAIKDLRETYKNNIIIGIEPALKPAVLLKRPGDVVIMATPMTLKEKKLSGLMKQYGRESSIVKMPCPGLVELIEDGKIEGEEIREYIYHKFKDYNSKNLAAVVLGCTHYPFIKQELEKVLPMGTPIIDGSMGTCLNLKNQLDARSILNTRNKGGSIIILNSSDRTEIIKVSHKLLNIKTLTK